MGMIVDDIWENYSQCPNCSTGFHSCLEQCVLEMKPFQQFESIKSPNKIKNSDFVNQIIKLHKVSDKPNDIIEEKPVKLQNIIEDMKNTFNENQMQYSVDNKMI